METRWTVGVTATSALVENLTLMNLKPETVDQGR